MATPEEPRDDRLFEVLDEMAGLPDDRSMPDVADVQPMPLTPARVEAAVARLQQTSPQVERRAPRRRPSWLWLAAALPIALVILIASFQPTIDWNGNKSEDLRYDDAFRVMADPASWQANERNTAMGRISHFLLRGVKSFPRHPKTLELQRELDHMRKVLRAALQEQTRVPPSPPPPGIADVVAVLRDPKASVAALRQAILTFTDLAVPGIQRIQAARRSPDELIRIQAPLVIAALSRRLGD